MSAEIQTALAAVRDIEGVIGSFLFDGHGRVLARDLPAPLGPEALASASLHLARLRDALEADGSTFESCVLRFGSHLLVLKAAPVDAGAGERNGEATLCVMCPRGTNLSAVQMGATLIVRHLQAVLAPALQPTVPIAPSAPRLFRGRPV